jgi:PTH1 family peptidyl-tRNA hydrolase
MKKKGCGPEDLLVIADELDLPWGRIQIRQRGGSAGHHGLESIMESIGTKEFARVRMGVAPEEAPKDPIRYLLAPVAPERREELAQFASLGAEATELILRQGVVKAMNQYNRRPGASEESKESEE